MRKFLLLLLISTLTLEVFSQQKKNLEETTTKSLDHEAVQQYLNLFASPVLNFQESIQRKISYIYEQFDKAMTVLSGKRLLPKYVERTSEERNRQMSILKSKAKHIDLFAQDVNALHQNSHESENPDLAASDNGDVTGENRRNLETLNCKNGGQEVTTDITKYRCNNVYVTQEVYNSKRYKFGFRSK